MKLLKKLHWLWISFWGRKYFITNVEEGLEEDEVLIHGHRVYLPKRRCKK